VGVFFEHSADDSPDIVNRQGSFIGQVDSVFCFFGKLSFEIKYSFVSLIEKVQHRFARL